jgi:hypothetical protein
MSSENTTNTGDLGECGSRKDLHVCLGGLEDLRG